MFLYRTVSNTTENVQPPATPGALEENTPAYENIEETDAYDNEGEIDIQDHQDAEASEDPQEQRVAEQPSSKKRKSKTDRILDTICKRSEERTKFLKQVHSRNDTKKSHPVQTFFQSMADTVMTFSPALIVRAKKRVLDVISELELENLDAESPSLFSMADPSRTTSSCSSSQHESQLNYTILQPSLIASSSSSSQLENQLNYTTLQPVSSPSYTCGQLFQNFQGNND